MPRLRYGHIETPSPFTFNGAKGMGEGGAAPLHTMCAAIQDAVYPHKVFVSDSHNTADSLFAAIHASGNGRSVKLERRS
jgi:2-furoyl-CoA dehydrogenase large subunit